MRARLAIAGLVALGGCMTDFDGDTCIWAPGSDGDCPDDSGGGSSGPTYHSYLSPTAAVIGDTLRVVMTGSESGVPATIETTTLPLGGIDEPDPSVDVLLDGEPLEAIVPRIGAIGDRAYLTWSDYDRYHGAPLGADGTIRGDQVIGFEGDWPIVTPVGDRYLVLVAGEGFLGGEWIDVDGARVGGAVIAERGVESSMMAVGDTPAGPVVAFAYWRDAGGRELAVARVDAAGAVGDPIVIARPIPAETWITGAEVAVASDGGILVVYRFQDGYDTAIRNARIDPATGAVTDQLSALPDVPLEMIRSGDRILAIGLADETTLSARILDDRGAIVGGPSYPGQVESGASFVPAPGGFAMVASQWSAVEATWLDERGAPLAPPVTVAERYEVGGCSAGGGAGLAPVLLAALMVGRRRRGPTSPAARRASRPRCRAAARPGSRARSADQPVCRRQCEHVWTWARTTPPETATVHAHSPKSPSPVLAITTGSSRSDR